MQKKLAMKELNCRDRAIVMLAMSTDMSIERIETLKVRDFLDGVRKKYSGIDQHSLNSREELSNYLNSKRNCCVWEIKDGDGNQYTTTSPPEINIAILEYLEFKLEQKGFINLDELLLM